MQLQRVAYRDIRIAAQSRKTGGEHCEADSDDTRDNKYDGEEENEPHRSTATRLCQGALDLACAVSLVGLGKEALACYQRVVPG